MSLYDLDASSSDENRPLEGSRPRKRGRIIRGIVASTIMLVVLGFGGWAYLNPQHIVDHVTVWQFSPSAQVVAHTERLSLTARGEFLYYASAPVVHSKESFANDCPTRSDEATYGILGCYQPSSKTIFLFDVTDSRLDGTEEVTAAHEMLHAAWDRLDTSTQQRLEGLLEAEYERLATEPAFVDRMAFYARTEPGQRANELHSIIGTEVNDLGTELEDYYATYFTDRSVVTSLHTTSNAVFVDLQKRASAIVAKLDELKIRIESDYESYTTGYTAFNASVADFNRRADGGEFVSQNQFDQERNSLLRRRDSLDTLFESITTRSARYDELVAQLDAINSTSTELSRGLNIGGEVSSAL